VGQTVSDEQREKKARDTIENLRKMLSAS